MIRESDQSICDSGDEILHISTAKTDTLRNSEDRWIVDGDKVLPVRMNTGANVVSFSGNHSIN